MTERNISLCFYMSCPIAAPSAQRFHWPWLLHAHITDEWMNGGKKFVFRLYTTQRIMKLVKEAS